MLDDLEKLKRVAGLPNLDFTEKPSKKYKPSNWLFILSVMSSLLDDLPLLLPNNMTVYVMLFVNS